MQGTQALGEPSGAPELWEAEGNSTLLSCHITPPPCVQKAKECHRGKEAWLIQRLCLGPVHL